MQRAVQQIIDHLPMKQAEVLSFDEVYVWVDYCCVAQEHRGMQKLAVSSLPAYASSCDAFIVVAPDAMHRDSGKSCNLQTYNSRGWCRAEMLAKVCSSGLESFFIAQDGNLEKVTNELDLLDLHVFNGYFSCCQLGHPDGSHCDKESLVPSTLGLYSLLLHRQKAQDSAEQLRSDHVIKYIIESKEQFFPRTFEYNTSGETTETRELFGPYVAALEDHVRAKSIQWSMSKAGSFFTRSSRTRSLSPQRFPSQGSMSNSPSSSAGDMSVRTGTASRKPTDSSPLPSISEIDYLSKIDLAMVPVNSEISSRSPTRTRL
eukprot:gnl/MRDRNA2_/MRDRNA2_35358_c0_seq1.p1 gnl/MRDRNA2_/MRDRNA2_35358_c0~~gnl/MRDRNA2_/MRDRNA2_35358_c0_seq1.p1  ORF type:complete len:316 (-),score=35.94 gnl/MRDRNA2_/MRDRNA2_35358_c0_seq1:369-1316(-)